MSTLVRVAQPMDVARITPLTTELGYPSTPAETARRLARILGTVDQGVFVAEDGDLVGWIHVVEVWSLGSEPWAEIRGLVVAERMRGRGIGRALVDAAAGWGTERGLTWLRVRTRADRNDTHQFYGRLAFEVLKSQLTFARRL